MMRETYIEPSALPPAERRARRAAGFRARRTARLLGITALLDIAAIAFGATILWLGAGTTVLTGGPMPTLLAFAGSVACATVANICTQRAGPGSTSITAALHLGVVLIAYTLRMTMIDTYFYSWVVVFGSAYIAMSTAVSLLTDALFERSRDRVSWRCIALAVSTAAVLLLPEVWAHSSLLIDLLIFTALLATVSALASRIIRGTRSARTHEV